MSLQRILGILMAVLAAAAVWLFSSDRSLARLQEGGVIRIGYAVEPPYAFLSAQGEVTGEAPEVARRIVERLGIRRIEWRQAEFGALIDELESGRVDVLAAGMFITPQRARRVLFSEPSFHVQPGLLVARGNPLGLHSYEQALARPGVRVAVLSGAVEETLLRDLGATAEQLVAVPDARTGRASVESGYAQGLALSSPTIRWMARHDLLGKTEAARPFEAPARFRSAGLGYGAFAFRLKDHRLQQAWNREMKNFIDGAEHRELVSPFGFSSAESPEGVTAADILRQ